MKNEPRKISTPVVYTSLFLLSASLLCFEIVSTRIASVIFFQDYAFITLSLALLGIGCGSAFAYYRIKPGDDPSRMTSRALLALGVLLCFFIVATIEFSITQPFVFLLFVVLPFVASGVVYAQMYRSYSSLSFKLYAADVTGAAVGAMASLGLIGYFGGPNTILLLALVAFTVAAFSLHPTLSTIKRAASYGVLAVSFVLLIMNGRNEFLGMVPIGNFPEKDFYYVYPNAATTSTIIDSRWSIYGRSDLVRYSDQDMVRQLFVDGAAGTQVYRFSGDVQHTQSTLQALLLQHTNAIPFLCLNRDEKRSMLVIGPGGGKEVLLGLFGDVDSITGVEVNPDFVNIVKDHKDFDGGLYTEFPRVRTIVEEGRHFVKQTRETFDLIVMALPSTAQMQNIEPFATSENYLLTKEAIGDYLKKLTPEGRLLFTVHNTWELIRLIATVESVFQDMGVAADEIKNHFVMVEAEYAPTIVIKKKAFTFEEAQRWKSTCLAMPHNIPTVTYLPFGLTDANHSPTSRFLVGASKSPDQLQAYMNVSRYDISPCTDDRPYFYKIFKGIPGEYAWLLVGTLGVSILVLWLPFRSMKGKQGDNSLKNVSLPLMVLACTGIGFMVLEVSLFQKLVLYLGSPTISLSVLLCSLLVGMGAGSFLGRNAFGDDIRKRIHMASIGIVAVGILLFLLSPVLLTMSLGFELPLRAAAGFLVVLPLAVVLGVPFPSCIQMLSLGRNERYIPWLYGVNGTMSVLGSVLAIVVSMLLGFSIAYGVGLFFYLCIVVFTFPSSRKIVHRSAAVRR